MWRNRKLRRQGLKPDLDPSWPMLSYLELAGNEGMEKKMNQVEKGMENEMEAGAL